MFRIFVGAMLAGILLTAATPDALAQKKKVTATVIMKGSVDDDKLAKPAVIVSAKGLEAVWKAWAVKGDMPKVDFTKNLVVAVYSAGSNLNLAGANLDDQGNLEVLGFGTRDFRPGFRYVLGTVSRDGVKTVSKKALPSE